MGNLPEIKSIVSYLILYASDTLVDIKCSQQYIIICNVFNILLHQGFYIEQNGINELMLCVLTDVLC